MNTDPQLRSHEQEYATPLYNTRRLFDGLFVFLCRGLELVVGSPFLLDKHLRRRHFFNNPGILREVDDVSFFNIDLAPYLDIFFSVMRTHRYIIVKQVIMTIGGIIKANATVDNAAFSFPRPHGISNSPSVTDSTSMPEQ